MASTRVAGHNTFVHELLLQFSNHCGICTRTWEVKVSGAMWVISKISERDHATAFCDFLVNDLGMMAEPVESAFEGLPLSVVAIQP